jgi:hypothetical protein
MGAIMTRAADAAANHAALVRQLYDEWNGHYVLRQLSQGAWYDVRHLTRAEAMTYRARADEALEIKYTKEHYG